MPLLHPVRVLSDKIPLRNVLIQGEALLILVDEKCSLLGYDAANNCNFLPTFRDNISVPFLGSREFNSFGFSTPEDGTDRLFRNGGKKLPLLAA